MYAEYGSALNTAVLRGILAPFAHVPWSAIMAESVLACDEETTAE